MHIQNFFAAVQAKGLYRPDIDGMRALAVLAVVAYHYSPANLPGGFIGVDVFFVISGYLITGILVRSVDSHNFTSYPQLLFDFYQRRIRRIFPTLLLVLITCFVLGWLLLFSSEFERTGKYIAAGAGYVENFVLWSESGYFNHAAVEKPLLHLWSLAVEEQFYIFWPLTLWIFVNRRLSLTAGIATVAILTFALNVGLVFTGHATHAFFSPVPRAWELMTGAWLAVARPHRADNRGRWGEMQAWVGLLLIGAGLLFIRPGSAFPGLWALLPVLGTALLIAAGHSTFLNGRILSWRPAVWIGLISYPLYLWHWVLFSFVVTVFGEGSATTRHATRAGLLILSVLLAWLSYQYFETPIRRSRKVRTSAWLAAAIGVVGIAGLGVFYGAGMPDRPASLVSAKAERYVESIRMGPLANSRDCFNAQASMTFLERMRARDALPAKWYCVLGDINSKDAVFAYGDSHARAMIPALDKYGRDFHVRVVFASIGSCLPLLDLVVDTEYPRACSALGRRMIERAADIRPRAIVLVAAWGSYLNPKYIRVAKGGSAVATFRSGLSETLKSYKRLGVPVLIMEDNPSQHGVVPIARIRFDQDPTDANLNATAITADAYQRQQESVNAVLQAGVADDPQASIVAPGSQLCNADICPWVINHQFLYYDSGHLSETGALRVYPLLAAQLNRLVAKQ